MKDINWTIEKKNPLNGRWEPQEYFTHRRHARNRRNVQIAGDPAPDQKRKEIRIRRWMRLPSKG